MVGRSLALCKEKKKRQIIAEKQISFYRDCKQIVIEIVMLMANNQIKILRKSEI